MQHAEALAELRAGRPGVAARLLLQHLHANEGDAHTWFLLGACHHALGELPAAAGAFSRSIALYPSNPDAHLAYVSVLRAAGDVQAALAASRRAQTALPTDARVYHASALCLEDLGQVLDALAHYDDALRVAPDFEDALHNRGILLARLGRFEDGEANQRRYVESHPGAFRAHSGLADALLALGKFDAALTALEEADRLSQGDVSVTVRQGVAHASLRRFSEARKAFAEARGRDPTGVSAFLQRIAPGSVAALMLSPENLFFWQCHLAFSRCDWDMWQACAEELRRLPQASGVLVEPAVAFIAFHLPLTGKERHAIAQHVASGIETRAAPFEAPPPRRSARLRIGVLSFDLREHLNAYLLLPLFEMLNREQFELYAYSLAPDDGSKIRAQLAAKADKFSDVQTADDHAAAAAIRADGIDILLDVSGHTTGGRFGITTRRPARIQAAYLGFAGSLGSKRVDYVITDAVVGGDLEEWSEQRVFLPHTYYLYDFRRAVPQMALARQNYGLPDDAFVYCAFHKPEKISPDSFEIWMRILARTGSAVLWLLALPDTAQRNLRREAAKFGIDPARLIFAPFDPRDRYLARHRLGDLMLDALHHSAMTTSCDALAAALPVLTLPGPAMASRAGESLLRAAGLPELVAPSKDAYVQLAVQLASDKERLNGYRRTLEARTGPLFDTEARVREIETALLQMWRQYQTRH